MIISVEFEYPDVLRIYPPQLDIEGKALAERVHSLDDDDARITELEEENEEALRDLENARDWKDGAITSIKEVTESMCELDDWIDDEFTDALERVILTSRELRDKLDKLRKKLENIK